MGTCQDCGQPTEGRSWFCDDCKYKRKLAATQRWRKRNPEKVAKENQDWRKRNPDYDSVYNANRPERQQKTQGVYCADCDARLNDQTCWCIYA